MLAGGVAHDFNNILMAIEGYSELLLAKMKEDDPLRRDVGAIQKATEQGAALTRQLLAFSRKQILTPKILDLNILLTKIEGFLRRLIDEHIELKLMFGPNLGRVKVDPGQMEQVIMNLAVNSRDAMPGGGRLILTTSNIHLDAEHAEDFED